MMRTVCLALALCRVGAPEHVCQRHDAFLAQGVAGQAQHLQPAALVLQRPCQVRRAVGPNLVARQVDEADGLVGLRAMRQW